MTSTAPVKAGPGHPVWDALNDVKTLQGLSAMVRMVLKRRSLPLARREAEAEAVLSTVCERALQRKDRFDASKGTPAQWLAGIAFNVMRNQPRSLTPPSDSVRRLAENPRIVERLAAAELVARIPADMREILLWDVDGLTGVEIGTRLGISPATARVRLFRARKFARELLASQQEGSHD